LPLYEIDKLPDQIRPPEKIPFREPKENDLWDAPLLLIIFILIITSEWVARKVVKLL